MKSKFGSSRPKRASALQVPAWLRSYRFQLAVDVGPEQIPDYDFWNLLGCRSVITKRMANFDSFPDLLDSIEKDQPVIDIPSERSIKKWAELAAANCLDHDEFETANSIVERFEIKFPFGELASYSIRHNEPELIEDQLATFPRKRLLYAYSELLSDTEYQKLKREFKSDFEQKFNERPDKVKLRWLTEFVWTHRVPDRSAGDGKLMLEDEVLSAFDTLKHRPGAGHAVASAYDIFLGTGEANRKLLDKMMKRIPEERQVVPSWDVGKRLLTQNRRFVRLLMRR